MIPIWAYVVGATGAFFGGFGVGLAFGYFAHPARCPGRRRYAALLDSLGIEEAA